MKTIFLTIIFTTAIFFFQNCGNYYNHAENREDVLYKYEFQYSFVEELNLCNTEFTLTAAYPPDEAPELTIIHITTNADTAGLMFEFMPEDNETWDNLGTTYLEKRVTSIFRIAERTSFEHKQIKVNYPFDVVHIDIDNGKYTTNLNVNSEAVVQIAFWNLVDPDNEEATLFVYDMNVDSSSHISARLYSDMDSSGFIVFPKYNDPFMYKYPSPFASNTYDFYTSKDGVSDPTQYRLGVMENQKIYIEYNGVIYYITAFSEIHYPLPKL